MKMTWTTLPLKKKFYRLMANVTGMLIFTILLLCISIYLLMGQTQSVLRDNNISLQFQAAMEAERQALRSWEAGVNAGARSELDQACRATDQAVEGLPDELSAMGLEQYQDTRAIKNSYRVYREKRAGLLAAERSEEDFSERLYQLYEMQGYLSQYGARLTQTVTRQGNQSYQALQEQLRFMPVALALVGFFLSLALAHTGRRMDEVFVEPVLELAGAADRMGANDFSVRLPRTDSRDEMGRLTEAFEHMRASTAKYIETLKENSELQLQLESVQLQMLKNQIDPHFLFNTLNMISCMAQLEEAETTDRMILAMSRLFQYALRSSDVVTPLSSEIKVVEDYMYLQKMRFESRLQYEISVEPGTEERLVPSFILQPLVENAVIHGIGVKEEGGFIRVRSWTEGAKLWLSVEDDGVGMDAAQGKAKEAERPRTKKGHGIGLGNIRKRIQIMYRDGVVEVQSHPGKGTRIKIGFTEEERNDGGTGHPDSGRG